MEKSKDVVVTEKGSHLSNGIHLCNGNKPGMTAETIVQIHSQVSRGCYFTRFQVTCAVFAFLLTIIVAIVLIAFVKKEHNIYVTRPSPVCSCDNTNGYNVTFAFTKESKNVTVLYAENLTQVENKTAVNVSSEEDGVVNEKLKAQKDRPLATQPYREIRLPRTLIPSFYDIELKIDLENDTFYGRVNMTLKSFNRTKFIIFHVNMLRVSRESIFVRNVNTRETIGIRKQFRVWSNQFYVLELKKEVTIGDTYIVEVNSFVGFINKDLKGLYLSTYTTPEGETRKLAATQLQSTDARKMFPCLDEPDMKARFAVTIIHQDKYTALSNMPPQTEQFIPPIWLKVKYHVTPIMSTYLLAIIVSDFKYQERNLTGDYRLKVWAQPNKINQTDYAMDMAEKCYLYFTDYFNISDIVPKADHVAVPDFSGGAMENWGLVIYRETALLYDPDVSSGENQLMVTLIVAHEVAHTWFGNMVTMKWWDDLWLNEGFASLLMYFAMDHIFPEWNVFTLHVVVREVFQVMVNDALVTSHPVSAPIIHPDDIAEYFDVISYSKGMAILRMLMGFIGWEDFKNGLRLYVRKYKFQNAEMEDLWETFSETVNYEIDVKSIMNTWTRQMGYPVVTMRTEGDYYLLEQERFLLDVNSSSANDSIYGYKWRIPFTYIIESNPDVGSQSLIWLNMTSAYIPREPNNWILGNIDYTGFYRINYELSMWGQLADQLNKDHKVFPEANRAGLIGDSFNLARAQILEYDVALNMTTYLKREDRYVPWKAFLSSLEFIKGSLSKTGAYVLLQKYLHDLVAPVFDKVGVYDKDGILPDSYLRQLILVTACDVGVKKAVSYAKDTFRKWKDKGIPVPKDYASVIYSVGVREGSVEEWDFVWNKTQETNVANEREMLMEALAQSQKPWLLWRYANWIFDPTKIRMQDVRLVVSFFTKNSLGRMIALHLLMNKWNRLNRQFGSDNFLIRETISDVTQYVNTNFEYKQLKTLFRNNPPKNARKETENALELIRANIKWMKDNYDIIADWLRQHTVGML